MSDHGASVSEFQQGPLLSLKSAAPHHTGSYLCRARNLHGSTEVEVKVNVISPLRVSLTPAFSTVDVGAEAKLTCSVHG